MKARRLLAVFAAFTVSAALFAGCTEGNENDNDNNDDDTGIVNPNPDDKKPEDEETPGVDTSTKLTGKIYVVGDSTVCDYRPKLDDYYLPRYGYGTMLYNYINCDENQIVNLALSGRSSKSFLTEANYTTLKNSIGEGDYLIIGFGHNDEKSDDPDRFTEPKGDYTVPGSFQNVLYENYVKLAKDVGATPIVCSPIVRYNATGEYDNKSVAHVTADGDYAAAVIKLGADTNTAVVDLTGITKEYYKAHNADAQYFHAFTTYNEVGADKVPDGIDTTHINMYGAKMISYMFVKNLPAGCPLKANVKGDIVAPTYEADFPAAIKADYKKPDYSGFDSSKHTAFATIGGANWYKTAMGVLGGDKAGSYSFTDNSNKYTISTDKGSKFADKQDGFGAIFTQIDITKNFTVSAKAKVTEEATTIDKQVAFGIMLRDDIYIDTNITTITSNFVSASIRGNGATNMSRTSKTALDNDGSLTYAKDVEYEITLTRVGQVVTATIKQGANSVTTTFTDISYVGIDNNNMYLCLFANRGLTVEFSDVTFAITGEAQGA